MIRWPLAAALLASAPYDPAMARDCLELPACNGCGCRGGPGYRAPDGHCVGYREMARFCGANPDERCKFENQPNTGANRDCVMGR